ncbi:Outer membrane protein assembly factor BamB [Streptomyces sp. RB5]|uniref:Outer membrane protein assembly factor BamB n=1 Tax=Streptomyces smaragdinus TaxID=2585196 RepID=A0A7K0CGF1_9ACTN|nr:PQQ-binding-like beta-propeller repeat protein [Streptomyces smaragdinus]MQY12463.1 Outer membrane protein assembly factor BamB [Streptomyces smaragdinus]
MRPLEPGDPRRLGEYELSGRLGAGGMGVVYFGRSPGGRPVAVKAVRGEYGVDGRYRERFRREVAAAREVNGAFTAAVLDTGDDGIPWLAMEYLPGLSLAEAVESYGPLPESAVRLLACAVAEALADIHRVGLTHRDLKPGNIMLTEFGPRVIDFGLVRPEDGGDLTVRGTLLGTVAYMSPEQASGAVSGAPGDVFALGSVLVFAATGRSPFEGGDRAAVLERVRAARTGPLGIRDRALRTAVELCLRREPDRRPAAGELLRRLGRPTGSVEGTGWLPIALGRAIAGSGPPATAYEASPGETTADSGSVPGTTVPPGRPGRRRLLRAGIGVTAAAAGVPVVWKAWEATRTEDAGEPSRPSSSPVARKPAVRLWSKQVAASDGGPRYLIAAGRTALAVADSLDGRVRVLDPRSGKQLWTRRADARGPSGFLTAGAGAVFAFDPRRSGDSTEPYTLRALDVASGRSRWTAEVPFFPWGILAAGQVVCYAEGSNITALDTGSGRTRWTASPGGLNIGGGPDAVLTTNEDRITALDARTGRTRWKRRVDEPDPPVTADGMVFTRNAFDSLIALRADDGARLWEKHIDYRCTVRHCGQGMVYVCGPEPEIRALRAATGETAWSRPIGTGGMRPVTLGRSGRTLWALVDTTLYALDTAGGRTLWTYEGETTDPSGAEFGDGAGILDFGDVLVVATVSGGVQALTPPDGEAHGRA